MNPYLYPGAHAPTPPRSPVLTVAVLLVMVLLCGGGGAAAYALLQKVDGPGAERPADAVSAFLTAVYVQLDPDRATDLVCAEARDLDEMRTKVGEIRDYVESHRNPRFSWAEPVVEEEDDERAVVSVDLVVTTDNERLGQQRMTVTVLRKTGWWVCEVQASPAS